MNQAGRRASARCHRPNVATALFLAAEVPQVDGHDDQPALPSPRLRDSQSSWR